MIQKPLIGKKDATPKDALAEILQLYFISERSCREFIFQLSKKNEYLEPPLLNTHVQFFHGNIAAIVDGYCTV